MEPCPTLLPRVWKFLYSQYFHLYGLIGRYQAFPLAEFVSQVIKTSQTRYTFPSIHTSCMSVIHKLHTRQAGISNSNLHDAVYARTQCITILYFLLHVTVLRIILCKKLLRYFFSLRHTLFKYIYLIYLSTICLWINKQYARYCDVVSTKLYANLGDAAVTSSCLIGNYVSCSTTVL